MKQMTWCGVAAVLALVGCKGPGPMLCDKYPCARFERCAPKELVCIIDRPPTIDAGVPLDVQGAFVPLTVVAGDDVLVAKLEYSIDNGAGWVPVELRDGVGNAQVTVPAGFDIRPLPIRVRALDGQEQAANVEVTATADNVGPRVTLLDAGQLYRGLVARLAVGVVDGADGGGTIADVSARFDGGILPVTATGPGLYSAQFDLPQGIQGQLEFVLSARDAVGNVTNTTNSIAVNTTGPAFTLVVLDGGVDKVASVPVTFGLKSSVPSRNAMATWRGQPVTLRGASPDYTVVLVADAGIDEVVGLLDVTAEDSSGSANTTSLSIGIDSVEPDAGFISPAEMAQLTDTTGVEVVVRATDTSGFGTVRLDFGDDAGFRLVTVADGGGRLTVPVRAENGVRHRMALAAVDRLGNVARPAIRTVTLDNVPPTVSFASPAAGFVAGGPGRTTVAVDVAASDGTQPAPTVAIAAGADTGAAAVVSGTTFRRTVTLPAGDGVMLALRATATDSFGNPAVETRSIQVDTVGPAVAFVAPAPGTSLNIASFAGATTLTVRFTATDGVRVASANLDFGDGQGFRAATSAGGNAYSIQVPLGAINGATRAMTAEAIDSVGNVTRVIQSVTIDNVPPTVSFVSPAASAEVGGTSLQVDVTAQDSTAVRIAIGNDDGPATLVSGTTYRRTVTLPAGLDFVARTLTATVTDAAGNTATATRSVTVDNVAPTVSFVSPTAGRSFNIQQLAAVGNVVNAQVTFADGSGAAGSNIEWRSQGDWASLGQIVTFPVPTSAADNGSASSPSGVAYALEARATDRRGNASPVATVSYTVDRVAPTATFVNVTAARFQPRTGMGISFSEAMVGNAAAFDFSPPIPSGAQVTWAADRRSSAVVGNITAATLYTLTATNSLTDTAGNPVSAPTPVRFSTTYEIPPRSTVLGSDVRLFDVASDLDGISYVYWQEQGPTTFGQTVSRLKVLNPLTGGFDDIAGIMAPPIARPAEDIELQATRTANGDLSVTRRLGFSVGPIGSGAADRTIYGAQRLESQAWSGIAGGFSFPNHIGQALSPEIPDEGLGSRPWATVFGGPTICRGSCRTLPFNPGFMIGVPEPAQYSGVLLSRNFVNWRSLHVENGTLRTGESSRQCNATVAGQPPDCSVGTFGSDVGPFVGVGIDRLQIATAHSRNGRCFAFTLPTSSSEDQVTFRFALATPFGVPPTYPSTASAARGTWQVSGSAEGVLVSRSGTAGGIEVLETTTDSCGAALTSLYTAPNSTALANLGTARAHRPAMLGTQKALFYVNSQNQLVVYYP